ncbi:MAG: hypothetical protein R3F11_25700 [Verrucomicrobiales bacterium]
MIATVTIAIVALSVPGYRAEGASGDFPPGWLPVAKLGAEPTWSEFREIEDRIHLYLPGEGKAVRGVFACFVFHSADPRELADLWNFALVTVPWPFEFDLGHNDQRNGRYKLGHEPGDMGVLLRYLGRAAEQTGHPELATVPIVGWLGQNGSHLCADLYARAPERVLAWGDSFPNRLRQYPQLTAAVPFAFAWEISNGELRDGIRRYKNEGEAPADLSCRATTYGFGHGIYSKFNFFMLFLDRCIRLRLPESIPDPGELAALPPVTRSEGWVGDFDPISGWNPIAPAKDEAALGAKYPVWFPDRYAAFSWRAYHSSCADLEIASPKLSYSKHGGKWGTEACGLGYGGYLSASEPQVFSAKVKGGDYAKVEFFDGDQKLGEATAEPWTRDGIRLEPGLRVLYAVGVKADGSRAASRPALAMVKP